MALLAASPEVLAQAAARAPYTEAVLQVSLNEQRFPDPVLALRDADGEVLLSGADLARWRLQPPSSAPVAIGGELYYLLRAYPGIKMRLAESTQFLEVEIAPAFFFPERILARPVVTLEPQRNATGGFLNYTVLGTTAAGASSAAATVEVEAFGPLGNLNSTAAAAADSAHASLTRLETAWSYVMPSRMAAVRVGDAVSSGGTWGGAVRFGGVQYATDFSTRPNLVLMPSQSIAGEARVPSTVDVLVNNALVARHEVRPGPFSVANIMPIAGSGEVSLVVRDVLGREQVIRQPFYASPQMFARGIESFSYEAGLLRKNLGVESFDYGDWFAGGTYRRGMSDAWTAEIHGEAEHGLANVGVASDVIVGGVGTVSANAAAGHDEQGGGLRAGVGFLRLSHQLTFNVAASWATRNFRLVGEHSPLDGVTTAGAPIMRELLVHAGYDFGAAGGLAASFVSQARRGEIPVTLASLTYTRATDHWGYMALTLSRARTDRRSVSLSVSWSMPLGRETSVSVSTQRYRRPDERDKNDTIMSVRRDLPLGEGYGYRVDASESGRVQAQGTYQALRGTYTLDLARADGATAARVTASGGVGLVNGQAFVSRTISESFGLVRLPGYGGVRVYSQNQVVGRTDADGDFVIPRLLPYQANVVRIEQHDLPLDARFERLEDTVVPFARSGAVVTFPIQRARDAIVVIHLEGGRPVPAGAVAQLNGGSEAFPVAMDGEAYFTGLVSRNQAVIRWAAKACAISFDYPEPADPQPRLGPFLCRSTQ